MDCKSFPYEEKCIKQRTVNAKDPLAGASRHLIKSFNLLPEFNDIQSIQ